MLLAVLFEKCGLRSLKTLYLGIGSKHLQVLGVFNVKLCDEHNGVEIFTHSFAVMPTEEKRRFRNMVEKKGWSQKARDGPIGV